MDYKVMIVEDDMAIRELLASYIKKYGYEVIAVDDFENIMGIFRNENPHIVLMDVNLPSFDGFYWCSKIRGESNVPIIFVSAREGTMDQVMGIESGGDDYILKPFQYEVVLAKIKSQIRRAYGTYSAPQGERVMELQGLTLFMERLELTYKDKSVMLTKKEGLLIECLMKSFPKVVSREVLLQKLWDDESFVEENTLNVNVTRVRKRFTDIGINDAVETVRGAGYRLNLSWGE